MIKKYVVKSCCGKQNTIFQVDKPINKSHLNTFVGAGYVAPTNFSDHGVFYVRGHGITATCSFGSNRINVRCSGSDCPQRLETFSQLLETALHG